MPLSRYGVAIGTYVSFHRDPPDSFGRYYHGHVTVATPEGTYESALDVNTPSGVGVAVKTIAPLDPALFATVSAMADGWHDLAPAPASGALDYVRDELLLDRCPPVSWLRPAGGWEFRRWLPALRRLVCLLLRRYRGWAHSDGDSALTRLEATLPGSRRVYLFGQHYTGSQRGVHDVHMNQGDPAGSQWYASDGVWQDGAVIVERADGTLAAWLVRFETQSLDTDAQGHPV